MGSTGSEPSADLVLRTTRAVRKKLDFDRPVPHDVIRECLELALQAPTGSNRQNWHFVVVTDEAQRAALGDLYRRAVASAAQAVLAARAAHPGATLADLYDPDGMPTDLQDAHRVLNKAVDAAYGYRGSKDDAARVAFLFALYQKLTDLLAAEQGSARRRKRATA